jgi:hypothetical protein
VLRGISKRKGIRRVYTEKAWKFSKIFKIVLSVLFSLILLPLLVLSYIGNIAESISYKLDDFLDWIVDNFTPSFRK